MKFSRLKVFARVLPVFLLLVAGVWLLTRTNSLTQESAASKEATADLLGLEGLARQRYVSDPGTEDEDAALMGLGDYYAHRYTYPTGQFDQRWLLEAVEQDSQVARGIPAGRITYDANNKGDSPLTLDPTQFTSLGPQPLQSDGCFNCFNFGHVAGRTNVIATDPLADNVAYIGSDGGGVWKTEDCCDENTTWTPVTDDPLLSTIAIGDIILDPNDHNTIYAGTGDLRYGSFTFGSAGLLKSTDGGDNWVMLGVDDFAPPRPQPAGEFPQYQAIGKVQVDPNDSDKVIVGTKTGIYFSYDAGANWTGPCLTNSHTDQRQDTTGLLVKDNGTTTTLYAGIGTRGFPTPVQPDLGLTGANGVYSTLMPNSGCPTSWTLLNSGWPAGTGDGDPANDLVGRIDLAMAPSDPNVIYAQVADNTNSSGTLGVWRTTNGGTTWTQQATPSDFTGCGGGVGQTWYNAGVTVDPNDPDVVFLSMIDSFRSVNGADTFVNLTCGYAGGEDVHVDNHGRAFVNGDSSRLIISSDGGVYYTGNADAVDPNAVAFTQMNDTLSTIEFYSGDITADFATATEPGINAGAQDNGSAVYVWDAGDPGPATWQVRLGGDGMFARIEPKAENKWYQELQAGSLYVSLSGPYGSLFNISSSWTGDRKSFVMPYEIYKYDCPGTECGHLAVGTYRIHETIVGGFPSTTWYINSPDLTKGTLADRSHINGLAFAVTDESILIVGTNDGNVQYGFGLGQGTANSATWVDVTGGNSVLPNRPILDVATDPVDPLIGYAAVGGFDQNTPAQPGHVYQVTCTADCASFTWANKSGNLPNIPVDSIIANPNFPQQVFAGTDWGLYYTDDINVASPIWFRFEAGLTHAMIWDMAIDRGFSTLALFTRSRGAYVWPLPSGPIAEVDYGVTIGPNSTIDTLPGTTVEHDFTVTNYGLENDSYNLAISGESWTTTLLTGTPIGVPSGESTTVTVEVDVPNVPYDSDSFTITATSVNSPTVSASAMGTTNAVVHPGVVATPDTTGQSGTPGDVLTYTITVENTGDYVDSFEVNLSGESWNTTASAMNTGPLDAGESTTIEIYVVVGSGSSDMVTVTFISELDMNISDSVDLTSSSDNLKVYLPVVIYS